MSPLPLACTVRDCGLLIEPRGRSWVCARGHAYDRARSGYINLLQPQDRRSRAAGDTKAALEARTRLLAAGVGRDVIETVAEGTRSLAEAASPVIVDLGCGGGEALDAVSRRRTIEGIGIDLSSAAAELAARRYAALTWVVANADRRLPLLDGTVDVVLSIHGRRNPGECARILTRDGVLIVAIPAADDLLELRELVQGRGVARDRTETLLEEHARWFAVRERTTVRTRQRLPRETLLDLLQATYRGERKSGAPRIAALDALEVTLASDVLIFDSRRTP